jgi:vacuolar-type H+-ATPase subunit I/STV1
MNSSNSSDGGEGVFENEYVKNLFGILHENGKDTAGLSALLSQLDTMENFVKQAESKISDMKSQLESMREIQNHPIKTALKNAVKTLENKVAEIKVQLAELKSNIIEGAKKALTEFKENGIAALDRITSFFGIKKGLQAVKTNISAGIDKCDKSIAKIADFSRESHVAGRHLKNMARILAGKKPVDAVKESGKLAKAASAPYRAHKAVLSGIAKSADLMIAKFEQLEQRAADRKPTIQERIEQNREKIKQKEAENPAPNRAAPSKGIEI